MDKKREVNGTPSAHHVPLKPTRPLEAEPDGTGGLRLSINVNQFYMEGFSGVIHLQADNPTPQGYDLVELTLVDEAPAKAEPFALGPGESRDRRFQLGELTSRGPKALSFRMRATRAQQVQEYRADITLHVLEKTGNARDIKLHTGGLELGRSSEKFNIGGVINIDIKNKISQGQIKTPNELMLEIDRSEPVLKPLVLEPVCGTLARRRKRIWPWIMVAAVFLLLLARISIQPLRNEPSAPAPEQPAPVPAVQPGAGSPSGSTPGATRPKSESPLLAPPQISPNPHDVARKPAPTSTNPPPKPTEPVKNDRPAATAGEGRDEPAHLPAQGTPAISTKTPASEKATVAIMPFRMLGDTATIDKDIRDMLAEALITGVDTERFEIIEGARLEALFLQHRTEPAAIVDDPGQAVIFGRLATVQYIALGSLGRLGGEYYVSARLVDCCNGKVKERAWVCFAPIAAWRDRALELLRLLGLRTDAGAPAVSPAVHHVLIDNDLINAAHASEDFGIRLRTADGRQLYTEGEYISFVVEVTQDCYLTLIAVENTGEIKLLLPNRYQRQAFLHRGEKVQIPAPDAGFRFPVTPPHGEMLLKAIGTPRPLILSGVTARDVDTQEFVTLERGVKVVGVEGAPRPEPERDGALHGLLGATGWCTSELVVVTQARAGP